MPEFTPFGFTLDPKSGRPRKKRKRSMRGDCRGDVLRVGNCQLCWSNSLPAHRTCVMRQVRTSWHAVFVRMAPSPPHILELACTCCAGDPTRRCNHKLLVVQRVDAALDESVDAVGPTGNGLDVAKSLIPEADCTPEHPFGKASLLFASRRGARAVSFFASFVKSPAIVKVWIQPGAPVYRCSTSGHKARTTNEHAELRGSVRVPCVHTRHVRDSCVEAIADIEATSARLPVRPVASGTRTAVVHTVP